MVTSLNATFEYDNFRPRMVSEACLNQDTVERLALDFANASPFPHIVLDNMLNVAPAEVEREFPDQDWPHWGRFDDAYQIQKQSCNKARYFPPLLNEIIQELSQTAFLEFLSSVTGIKALFPDPHLIGGGLHASGVGGILAPHTDFHLHDTLSIFRRVNVILYLNPAWEKSWGGSLGLYNRRSRNPEKTVEPIFGRMVIFRTDHHSIHGFTDPVTEGHRRKSIALYYYTSTDSKEFSGNTTTFWRQHGELGPLGKAQLALHRFTLGVSNVIARHAHSINPHMGRYGVARPRKAAER